MDFNSNKSSFKIAAASVLLAGTALVLAGCEQIFGAETGAEVSGAASFAFRDAVGKAPPGTKNPFRLSADYPTTAPGPCEECRWLAIDVDFADQPAGSLPRDWDKGNWGAYLDAILAYVREGQDPNLADDIGFQTKVGGGTRWFSVPWMAYDETSGREVFHGATNERTLFLSDFDPEDDSAPSDPHLANATHMLPGTTPACQQANKAGFESWSVGYYNEYGGYALGQAIPKSGEPQASTDGMTLKGLPFPEGTAVVKVLTTSATPDCVSYLKGSPEWTVDRHKLDETTNEYMCERAPQVSRIVQVDVAVRDERSPSGWVYGTFAYDGTRGGKTFWDNLLPLGLQWGGDPTVFPAVSTKTTPPPLQQTILYPDVDIFEHGGCQTRLAGPADNAQSSCVSCHASAFSTKLGVVPVMGENVPPSFGFQGICTTPNAENSAYFNTIKAPAAYGDAKYAGTLSLDTSLQLAVAMSQFAQYKTAGKPKACTLDKPKSAAGGTAKGAMKGAAK